MKNVTTAVHHDNTVLAKINSISGMSHSFVTSIAASADVYKMNKL